MPLQQTKPGSISDDVRKARDQVRASPMPGLPLYFTEWSTSYNPRDPIRPTDRAPIVRPLDPDHPAAGLELVELRWGLVPWFHRRPAREWKARIFAAHWDWKPGRCARRRDGRERNLTRT